MHSKKLELLQRRRAMKSVPTMIPANANCDNCGKAVRRKWIQYDHTACSKRCLRDLVAIDAQDEERTTEACL